MSIRNTPSAQVNGRDPFSIEAAIREIQDYQRRNFGREVIDLGGARLVGAQEGLDHDHLVTGAQLQKIQQQINTLTRGPRSGVAPAGPLSVNTGTSNSDGLGGGPGTGGGGDLPTGCFRSASGGQFMAAVTTEIERDILANPPGGGGITFSSQAEAEAYADRVALAITNGGYGLTCQVDPGDHKEIEMQFTTNPTFNEHYAIYTSFLTVRRPPGAYTATCSPPQV